ncbi:Retron-type RNA-directed DNA polymerase, partial [hydrothermal vent metagenome]
LMKKVRLTIKTLRAATPQIVIGQLNPILRGWANYHKHVVSKDIFKKIDHLIFESIWRWSKRRHPNKSAKWVKRKYFTRINNTDWVFCSHPKGEKCRIIFKLGWIPIRRHIQIQSHRNPYDSLDSDYFDKRSKKKKFSGQLDLH